MAAVGFCVVILGVLVAGVVSRDDSGKSSNTSPPVSVGVTQTTTTVEGQTVTQTAPPATVTGEVTVTGSTPTTTRTTPTTPTTTRTTTGASGTSTTTSSP